MSATCVNCGAALGASERFCAGCGTKVATAEYEPGTVLSEPRNWPDASVATSPSLPAPRPSSAPMAPTAGNRNPPPSMPAMTNNQTVNVNTNIAIVQRNTGPNLFVRAIWFVFIGWWLGGGAIALAYLLFIPIITIPLGIAILNRIPQVMTLRPRTSNYTVTQMGDTLVVEESTLPQRPWLQRILYLVFVGWWFGAIWLSAAWAVGVFTLGLGLPLSFWMFNRAGAVISLYRT